MFKSSPSSSHPGQEIMFVDTTGAQRPPPFPGPLHYSSVNPNNVSFSSDAPINNDSELPDRDSSSSGVSGDGLDTSSASPYWNQLSSSNTSPYSKSPWTLHASLTPTPSPFASLLGSLVREEGHIYSLAASADLLYTGSDSKNIRVWRHQREFSGFKSSSGLVKAIVILPSPSTDGNHHDLRLRRVIFTGHQDGKIRIWRAASRDPKSHKRHGSLPRLKDYLRSSFRPGKPSLSRHHDAISCLSVTPDGSVLYSGSWDRTFKAWRVANSRCLDSVSAHDDSVNAIVTAPGGLVFTGSADGTIKAWRREDTPPSAGKPRARHAHLRTVLEQESAVTSLVLSTGDEWGMGMFLYCGSSDGLVSFWALEGEEMAYGGELKGHVLAVLCIATAGSVVVSGSADKTMCVWRRTAGGREHECVAVLTGHLGPVKCLAVVRDEEASSAAGTPAWTVYSGSLDKSVKVWRVTEGQPEQWNASVGEDSCSGGDFSGGLYEGGFGSGGQERRP